MEWIVFNKDYNWSYDGTPAPYEFDVKTVRRIYDVGTPLDKPSDLDVFVNYAEGWRI